MVTFPRFMATIFELSFVGKDFRELVASLTANKFFAGVSNFLEAYKCVMTANSEKIRSEIIFRGKFPSGFDKAAILCHKKYIARYIGTTIFAVSGLLVMQHQQFNILRKYYVFLLKLLKTLIVNRLSGYARGLNDVCGSFV